MERGNVSSPVNTGAIQERKETELKSMLRCS